MGVPESINSREDLALMSGIRINGKGAEFM